MNEMGFWDGIWHELSTAGRFRMILQPTLAIVLGIRIGLADARAGTPCSSPPHGRWTLLRESIGHAALPLTLALLMDCIFQYLALGRVRVLAAGGRHPAGVAAVLERARSREPRLDAASPADGTPGGVGLSRGGRHRGTWVRRPLVASERNDSSPPASTR